MSTGKRERDVEDESSPSSGKRRSVESLMMTFFKYNDDKQEDNNQDEEKRAQGLTWDPIICEWVNDGDEEEEEEEEYQYNFQNSEAFLAALELYNRRGCTIIQNVVTPNRDWECRKVAGQHSKLCDSCGASFNEGASYYCVEKSSSGWYYQGAKNKGCLPCMERLLFGECGTTDLSTIKEMREKLRKSHEGRPGDNYIVPYEKRHPDYPIFLSHCKENDEDGSGKAPNGNGSWCRLGHVSSHKLFQWPLIQSPNQRRTTCSPARIWSFYVVKIILASL